MSETLDKDYILLTLESDKNEVLQYVRNQLEQALVYSFDMLRRKFRADHLEANDLKHRGRDKIRGNVMYLYAKEAAISVENHETVDIDELPTILSSNHKGTIVNIYNDEGELISVSFDGYSTGKSALKDGKISLQLSQSGGVMIPDPSIPEEQPLEVKPENIKIIHGDIVYTLAA